MTVCLDSVSMDMFLGEMVRQELNARPDFRNVDFLKYEIQIYRRIHPVLRETLNAIPIWQAQYLLMLKRDREIAQVLNISFNQILEQKIVNERSGMTKMSSPLQFLDYSIFDDFELKTSRKKNRKNKNITLPKEAKP